MANRGHLTRQSSNPAPWMLPTPFDDMLWNHRFGRGFDDFNLPYWARRQPLSRLGAPAADFIPELEMHRPMDFGIDRQVSEVHDGSDVFRVKLDVSQYKPDEIEVKTIGNEVIVKGTHEERQDEHGFVSRQFSRRYTIPEGAKPENVVSKLSKEGFLTIEAPKQNAVTGERMIPIQADPGQ